MHDVVVWAIILHLVCREVTRRSSRVLHAGRLEFNIASAHVYEKNRRDADMVSRRVPIDGTRATLEVAESAQSKSMSEIADDFDHGPEHLVVRGYERDDAHAPVRFDLAVG